MLRSGFPPDRAVIERALEVLEGRRTSAQLGGGFVVRREQRIRDLVDQRTMQLSYQATHDAVTGFITRQEFENVVERAIARSNTDVGGRLVEMGETEYMVRGKGYIQSLDDLRQIIAAAPTWLAPGGWLAVVGPVADEPLDKLLVI